MDDRLNIFSRVLEKKWEREMKERVGEVKIVIPRFRALARGTRVLCSGFFYYIFDVKAVSCPPTTIHNAVWFFVMLYNDSECS